MKRIVIAVALLALSATAPAGAIARPAHSDRCAPRAHEEVRARSGSAVVLLRRTRVLIGCSTVTGRRRVLETVPGSGVFIEKVRVRGTAVAYVVTAASRYGDGLSELWREDAVREGWGMLVEPSAWVGEVAIGAGGTIAYTTSGGPAQVLRLNRRDGTMLHVDGALHLRGLRLTGDRLTWRHGTTTRSADVTPVDRCGGHSGTLTLALIPHTAPASVTACIRATGATRTLLTSQPHSTAASETWITAYSAMVAGPWIATHPDGATIITTNLATNAGETIPAPAPGVGFFLAINANGTVAWTAGSALLGTSQIFVHDATGTRQIDTADGVLTFGFDGTVLRYGAKTLRLPH